jgi:hypothetical protein
LQFFIEQNSKLTETPYRSISVAQGGQQLNAYYQRGDAYINSGGYADKALFLVYSINDGVPTKSIMDNCKTKAILFADKCRKSGIKPYFITAFPLGTGYTESQLVLLNDLLDFVDKMGYPYLNPLEIYGVKPNYGWQPTYQFDNSHMTDAGYQDLANRVIDMMKF